MKAYELETKLTEKFGMKRFTKQELNEYLNNHFGLKETKMLEVIYKYLDKYKNEVMATVEEFGYTVDLEKIETMAQNRKNKIINGFDNGVDISRGLVKSVVKPIDIIERDNKFFYVVVVNKKKWLYNIDDLFR